MTHPPALRRFLIFYLAALAFCWTLGLAGAALRSRFMHTTHVLDGLWVYNGADAHADLGAFDPKLQRFHSASGSGPGVLVYPAPLMCVYFALMHAKPDSVTFYSAVLCVLAAFLAILFAWILVRRSPSDRTLLAITGVASIASFYPFWFTVERSNLEAVVWVLVLAAVAALASRWYKSAALFVALGAATKLYPGILLLVFLKEKRYKELALSCFLFVAVNLLGLWIVNPDILAANREVAGGLSQLNQGHASAYIHKEIGFDHSLFSPVKHILHAAYPRLAQQDNALNAKVASAVRLYVPLVLIAFAAGYLLVLRKLPLPNLIVALLILGITLPMMSLEYTLLLAFPALALFLLSLVAATQSGTHLSVRWVQAVLLAFAVIAAPLTWFSGRYAGYGGQVKLLALGIILFYACSFPMQLVPAVRRSLAVPAVARA